MARQILRPKRDRRAGLGRFFTDQLAARSVDEMQPAAGLADHGLEGALRIVDGWFIRQPVLHVQAGGGTFEDDIAHTASQSGIDTVVRLDLRQHPKTRVMPRRSSAKAVHFIDGFRDHADSEHPLPGLSQELDLRFGVAWSRNLRKVRVIIRSR